VSFVVTIDGPAAAGKSTTARAVAQALGFLYVDTGALYRALALKVQNGGVSPEDREAIARIAGETRFDLSGSPDRPHVWLDGLEVSGEIRTPAVSELASRLAAQSEVRRRLVEVQRELRSRGALVAEGRDLGTVVYPDADVKIFIEADLATRAQRRYRELERRGIAIPLDQVREELERRDHRDRGRADSPLVVAQDARVLDTTGMTVEQQVQAVLDMVRAHPRCPGRDGSIPGVPPAPDAGGNEPTVEAPGN
jgi:cytidylate kinase